MNLINENSKSLLLAKIKFEPTFFPVLWRFAFPLPLFGEADGRGIRGEFRPPSPLIKSVRIFSNTHRKQILRKKICYAGLYFVCVIWGKFCFFKYFLFSTLFQSTKYKLLTTVNFAEIKFICGGGGTRTHKPPYDGRV